METETTLTTTATKAQLPPPLREALADYKREQGLSDTELGKELGVSATVANRLINGKYPGDVGVMQAAVEDMLRSAPQRRRIAEALVPNAFTSVVSAVLDTIRRTADVGVVTSAAGRGKTSGISLYLLSSPLTLVVSIAKWSGGAGSMARLMWGKIETRGWKGNTNRSEYIAERLAGSKRLVVVDNAHRLTRGALQWLFDLHDATGCGIALVGNPEVLERIRANDQMFSRVGLCRHLDNVGGLSDDVNTTLRNLWPEAEGELRDLARQVAKNKGHLRALRKQLLLARELHQPGKSPRTAFMMAHTQLIREYDLKEGA